MKLIIALIVATLFAGSAGAGGLGGGIDCSSDGAGTKTCQLRPTVPGSYGVSISRTEVFVYRIGPPGPTKIVFRVAQPK